MVLDCSPGRFGRLSDIFGRHGEALARLPAWAASMAAFMERRFVGRRNFLPGQDKRKDL
jgi:hypothetical protein